MKYIDSTTKDVLKRKLIELFGIDVRTLALLRVGLSLVLLCDLVNRSRFLTAFYGDKGILPAPLLEYLRASPLTSYFNTHYFTTYLLDESLAYHVFLFCLAGIFATMMLVGWKTTFATVCSWFMFASLFDRNPLITYGADMEVKVLLFWAMFLPLGKVFSIDSALKKIKNVFDTTTIVFSPASSALVLQVGFIYLFAAMLKTGDQWRIDGTAVYLALHLDKFTNSLSPLLLMMPMSILMVLTFFVFWLQRLSFIFLFLPFFTVWSRTVTMILLVIMQLGFLTFLHLGIFPYASILAILVFLHPRIWDWIFFKLESPARLNFTLYYDSECGFCKRSALLIKTFFLIPKTAVSPARINKDVQRTMTVENSWVAVDADGTHHTGFQAAIAIAKVSPILFLFVPLMQLNFVSKIGEGVYRYIANHRGTTCASENNTNVVPETSLLHAIVMHTKHIIFWIVPPVILVLVLWVNLASVHLAPPMLPKLSGITPKAIVEYLHVNQTWYMFAPYPGVEDGWLVIPARTGDGHEVDLYSKNNFVTFEKPKRIYKLGDTPRWQRYIENLLRDNSQVEWKQFASWLCYDWNSTHDTDADKIVSLSIFYMAEENTMKTLDKPAARVPELLDYTCAR